MKMFAGIDFGKVTSCGIIAVTDGAPKVIDTLQVMLDDAEPKKKLPKKQKGTKRRKPRRATPEQLSQRLVRLDDFLELVLTSWNFELVGLEIPPGVKDQQVFQQLSMYYGLAMARCAKVRVPFKPMTVTEWRKWIGIRGAPPSGWKKAQRTEMIKRTVVRTVNHNTGSTFETKDHDRADGAGIALAAAVVKGAYNVSDEVWHA